MAITVAATTSGNEITDAVRTTGTLGDGRTPPDSSYGIWEATTNLVANGGCETNANGWTAQTGSARSTAQAKFGVASLAAVTINIDNTLGYLTIAVVSGTTYTLSAWVYIPSVFDGGGVSIGPGAQTATTIVSQANADLSKRDQWQRIWCIYTVTGVSASVNQRLAWTGATPTNGRTIFIDGAQLEAKAYPTPYVETNGASASRSAAQVSIPKGLLDPVQGWVACCVRAEWPSSAPPSGGFPRVWEYAADTTNRLFLTGATGFMWQFVRGAYGASNPSDTFSAGATRILLCYWTTSGHIMSINGAAIIGTGGTVLSNRDALAAAAYTFGIGYAPSVASRTLDGEILWLCAGTGTLTNADAATLNGFGNTDPTLAQLAALNGGAASPTFVWTADTATVNLPTPALLTLSAGEASSPSLGKGASLARAAAAPSSGTLGRGVGVAYTQAASSVATQGRGIARALLGTASAAPSHRKGVALARTTVAPSVASRALGVGAAYAAVASSVATIGRGIARAFAALVSSLASFFITEYGTVTLTDQAVTTAALTDAAVTTVALTDTLV